MTTQPTSPVQRNEARRTANDPETGDPIDESIDESMAEADRANGEGDPDNASERRPNGAKNGPDPS